jgi:uncharacterized membrane protein YbhN (UPF0104 family)
MEQGIAQTSFAFHSRWLKKAGLFLSAVVLGFAIYSLSHIALSLSPGDIAQALHAASPGKVLFCGVLTGISFASLGSYDALAVRAIVPRRVSSARAWFCGAVANAISNTIGFHAVTSTAVRHHLLRRQGLDGTQAAVITAYSWSTLSFGFASVFALALLASPVAGMWQWAGGIVLLAVLLLLARWLGPGTTIMAGGRKFRLPSGATALKQMALGSVEMASAIGALYVLMPEEQTGSFAHFSLIYIGAVLLGIVSHAPGGIGVFEAAMLALSSGQDRAAALVALVLYRLIYNLGPFALAVLALAAEEILARLSSKADSS